MNRAHLGASATAMLAIAAVVAGCAQGPSSRALDTATDSEELNQFARYCGKTMGLAVRCNLFSGSDDYAIARAEIAGHLAETGKGRLGDELVEAFDLATLEQVSLVGECTIPPSEMRSLLDEFKDAVDSCTGE